jgi:hypothetical protein
MAALPVNNGTITNQRLLRFGKIIPWTSPSIKKTTASAENVRASQGPNSVSLVSSKNSSRSLSLSAGIPSITLAQASIAIVIGITQSRKSIIHIGDLGKLPIPVLRKCPRFYLDSLQACLRKAYSIRKRLFFLKKARGEMQCCRVFEGKKGR